MSFKALVATAQRKSALGLLHARKHSPTIMFVAGAVGVVATAILTARATLKVSDGLDETANVLKEIDEVPGATDQEKMQGKMLVYGKLAVFLGKAYAPAIITGTLSLAALGGAHYIQVRRISALGAAYLTIDRSFKSYRERVQGEVGAEKELELYRGQEYTEVVNSDGVTQVPAHGTVKAPYTFLWDETCRNWTQDYRYNAMFLRSQQDYANDRLRAFGYVFLNDILDSLGLPRVPEGQIVGWLQGNGDDFVDFGIFDGDSYMGTQFVAGNVPGVWLTFNVDGPIYKQI